VNKVLHSSHAHTTNLCSAALACLSVLLLLSSVGCKETEPAEEKPTVRVEVVHPQVGEITEDILSDGVLAPVAQAAIASKVSAPIKQFLVQRGSHVRAGQLLATLENADLAAAAVDNKGQYTAAQGAYIVATQSTLPEDQTRARLDVEQAKATLTLDKSIFDARTQLFKQGASPGRDVDVAKATVMQAQAALDIAQQHFDSLQKASHKASIDIAQGQQQSARGKLMQAEATLSYTQLRSPINGVVTERSLFAGDTATAGVPILTLMDTSTLIAKLHLAQAQVQQLQLGSQAELAVPGIDDPITASVSLISPALDPGSTTVEVWLKVANEKGLLKAGASVHATIKGRTFKNALTIPVEALQRSAETGGKMVMLMLDDGTAKKKNVTVGIQTTESVQILSGLQPTDTVITVGSFGLDDGSKVKIGAAKEEKDGGDLKKGGDSKDKDADEKSVRPAKPTPGEKE
jgi:HlyD family secretion protein